MMATKFRIAAACLFAYSLSCWGIPNPWTTNQVHAQSSTSDLSTYTKNRLNAAPNRNSMKHFSANRFEQRAYQRAVPQYSQYKGVNKQIFSTFNSSKNQTRKKNKPFSSSTRGPAVTPYLGLTGLPSGGAPNYYSNVKPQLDQQRLNQRAQRENMKMQHQLNQMSAQAPFNPKGSEQMAPTGHAAVYLDLGGYYPQQRR
jgi:hypothetical protein